MDYILEKIFEIIAYWIVKKTLSAKIHSVFSSFHFN